MTALHVCAGAALDIARKHEPEGWRVRRVSETVRNPANAPDADEREVLRFWAEEKHAGRLGGASEHSEVVTQGDKQVFRYMRPIFIADPVCLQCHGQPDKLGPGVAEALKELYPEDQATGYVVGDLRGAISVKVPLRAEREKE